MIILLAFSVTILMSPALSFFLLLAPVKCGSNGVQNYQSLGPWGMQYLVGRGALVIKIRSTDRDITKQTDFYVLARLHKSTPELRILSCNNGGCLML